MTTQISLSFELICLINWLLKNERSMLNSLVKHAIEHGLVEELENADNIDIAQNADFLYATILEFLDFLEQTLLKNLETIEIDVKTKNALLPALHRIETEKLDFRTMWLSMQQTKARVDKKRTKLLNVVDKPQQVEMEILFEELLKNWKPNNKETLN